MTADPPWSRAHHCAVVTDPRSDRSPLHELLDSGASARDAGIAGAESGDDLEQFGQAKHAWLKTFLALPPGLPSHDTVRRRFARRDPDAVQRGFLRWSEAVHETTDRPGGASDGQTRRRSFDRANGQSTLPMAHAGATANPRRLGQVPGTQSPTRSRRSPSG
jgi:DDE_Tnp_1-associated